MIGGWSSWSGWPFRPTTQHTLHQTFVHLVLQVSREDGFDSSPQPTISFPRICLLHSVVLRDVVTEKVATLRLLEKQLSKLILGGPFIDIPEDLVP